MLPCQVNAKAGEGQRNGTSPDPRAARPYAPDYVSAETLAYRLDCSRATIDNYVRLGLLPRPVMVGNLQRWDFAEVKAFIAAQNREWQSRQSGDERSDDEDAYMKGLRSGTAA
jgi:predicted DNA-binding transcriptional regulator AlpA